MPSPSEVRATSLCEGVLELIGRKELLKELSSVAWKEIVFHCICWASYRDFYDLQMISLHANNLERYEEHLDEIVETEDNKDE